MSRAFENQKTEWEVGDLIAKKREGENSSELRLLTEKIAGKHEKFVRWRCLVFSGSETRDTVFGLRDPGRSLWKLVTSDERPL